MKNLKVSPPKIIEQVDRFGKDSRFVNQIGSVPSTDTEMFGCEIVRDLPDYVNNFVNQIGHDVVIKVPMSNPDSLTGSGENGKCHLNSKLLSLLNGGNRLLGYSLVVFEKNNHLCFLYGHSVWNPSEGKTRCVTDHLIDEGYEGFRDKLLYNDYLLFVPVGLNDIDRHNGFWLDDFIIYEGDNSFCLMSKNQNFDPQYVLDNQSKYVTMRTELKKRFENRGHIFSSYNFNKSMSFLDQLKESHFSKESLFTGKSWGYFKNKLLNTYFPTKQVSLSF